MSALAAVAKRAIDEALHGSQLMVAPPRTKVGFVEAIILRALTDIAAGWTPLYSREGLALEIAGVFCHAAPMVAYTGADGRGRRCELADLLVAVDSVQRGAWERKATLIQAKMARAAGRVSVFGSSPRNQLALYQRWPVFDFEEAAYGLMRVDFSQGGGAPNSGALNPVERPLLDP